MRAVIPWLFLLAIAVMAGPRAPRVPNERRDLAPAKPLKQTNRRDIVTRATRPRPKRATISPGVTPGCGKGVSFVMAAGGSGITTADGTYAQKYGASPNGPYYVYAAFYNGVLQNAQLYTLDSNCYLVRSDGQYAYGSDQDATTGVTYIPFNQQKANITPANGYYFIQCAVGAGSFLTCQLANVTPPSAQTQLVLCTITGVQPAVLGLRDQAKGSQSTCSAVTIVALAASP